MRSTHPWLLLGVPILFACAGDPAGTDETSTSTSDSDAETAGTDTETGGEQDECDSAAFAIAPPATMTVDGLPAVPIDIHGIAAVMTFNLADQYGLVDVTMTFQVGEQGGMPLFDVRQNILVAEFDGQTFDPALLARHDFGHGESFGFRVVEVELEPCSIHTLRLGYELANPQDGSSDSAFDWSPEGLVFDSKFHEGSISEPEPSIYLDSWLPANLPFDHHTLSITMLAEAASAPHMVITNGELEELAENQWQLEFGPETTSMSPYFGIVPVDLNTTASGVHVAPNGQDIPYVFHHNGAMTLGCTVDVCESQLLMYVDQFVSYYGDFQHPTLIANLNDDVAGGHYAGVTTGSQLNRFIIELSYSWWGAGIFPARYTDAWLKHGWALYSLDHLYDQQAFDWAMEPPLALVDPAPYARSVYPDAYDAGNRLFEGLAAIIGPQAVPDTMAEIYLQHAPLGSVTTEEVERQFYCLNGEEPDVRRAFWRYVYGFEGEPEPPPADYCD